MPAVGNDPFVQILLNAIRNGGTVSVTYSDTERVIEPHAVGYDKNNNLVARVYQTFEYPDSKSGWKLMRVDKMQSISHCENPSQAPRDGYKKGDSVMVVILGEI